MDIHKTTLAKLCRVCARTAESKKGYVTIKNVSEYSNILYYHYSVDIDLDSDMIYPKTLCGSCNRKLDKLQEKNEPSNLVACKFEAHRDLYCLIYEKNVNQKGSVIAHLKYLDGVVVEKGFVKVSENSYNVKRIYCITSQDLPLQIKIVISILDDFSWSLSTKRKTVSCNNLYLKKQPDKLTDENVEQFADFIVNSKLCQGIKEYEDVLRDRLDLKQTFQDENGEVVAYVEDKVTDCRLTQENFTVVRHKDCKIICTKDLCTLCGNYQSNMRVNGYRLK